MSRRLLPLLTCLVMLVVACEGDTAPTTSTAATTATTTPATTTTGAPSEPVVLAYDFAPGEVFAHAVRIERKVTLATDGSPEAPLDPLPASAELVATSAGTIELEVVEPVPAGFRLAVRADLDEPVVEGTVGGEPLADGTVPEGLGELLAVPDRLVVDTTGVVARPADPGVGLLSDVLTRWTGLLGPVLPDTAVTPGEEWTREAGPASVTARVTAQADGGLLLDGVSRTSGTESDLSEFYADYLGAFGEPDIKPALVLDRDGGDDRWEAVFDPDRGRLVTAGASGTTGAEIRGTAPDPSAGGEAEFRVRVETEDSIEVGPGG